MKLTKLEMDRLWEIANHWASASSCGISPKITNRLIEKGLLFKKGGRVAKSGRVVQHADAYVTEAGRQVLAGMPLTAHGETP